MVVAIGGNSGQEIVIDLKPGVQRNVSLYRLCDVWGYSYNDRTPLALRLECIFADYDNPNPALFKSGFTCPPEAPSVVDEFLYVHGGVAGGMWNWGQAGRVNGALLRPDAIRYLATELASAIR